MDHIFNLELIQKEMEDLILNAPKLSKEVASMSQEIVKIVSKKVAHLKSSYSAVTTLREVDDSPMDGLEVANATVIFVH